MPILLKDLIENMRKDNIQVPCCFYKATADDKAVYDKYNSPITFNSVGGWECNHQCEDEEDL
jgi:hypothetical protein